MRPRGEGGGLGLACHGVMGDRDGAVHPAASIAHLLGVVEVLETEQGGWEGTAGWGKELPGPEAQRLENRACPELA